MNKGPCLPYLPFASLSSDEKYLITEPDQVYSPLNQGQTLGEKSSKTFFRLSPMYSIKKRREEDCAHLVNNNPTFETNKHHATRPIEMSLSPPTVSTLARRASIASSLNSHPRTCMMSSSPLGTAGQTRTPKVPPVPTRYYAERLAPDEPQTIHGTGPPERPKSRPQLPPQTFWNNYNDAAVEHSPDSTIVCNSGKTGAPQTNKLEEKAVIRARYSFLPPEYQGTRASSIYEEYIPDLDNHEFGHACSEVSYENLRKGCPTVTKETFDISQTLGGQGGSREAAGKEEVRRKRSRTLVKQRQPSDGGVGGFPKGGGRSWITVAL